MEGFARRSAFKNGAELSRHEGCHREPAIRERGGTISILTVLLGRVRPQRPHRSLRTRALRHLRRACASAFSPPDDISFSDIATALGEPLRRVHAGPRSVPDRGRDGEGEHGGGAALSGVRDTDKTIATPRSENSCKSIDCCGANCPAIKTRHASRSQWFCSTSTSGTAIGRAERSFPVGLPTKLQKVIDEAVGGSHGAGSARLSPSVGVDCRHRAARRPRRSSSTFRIRQDGGWVRGGWFVGATHGLVNHLLQPFGGSPVLREASFRAPDRRPEADVEKDHADLDARLVLIAGQLAPQQSIDLQELPDGGVAIVRWRHALERELRHLHAHLRHHDLGPGRTGGPHVYASQRFTESGGDVGKRDVVGRENSEAHARRDCRRACVRDDRWGSLVGAPQQHGQDRDCSTCSQIGPQTSLVSEQSAPFLNADR